MMQKALIGQIVLTRYNCQTMRVDDIDFNHSPRSTFDVSYDLLINFQCTYSPLAVIMMSSETSSYVICFTCSSVS